jgi:hypothetical protein
MQVHIDLENNNSIRRDRTVVGYITNYAISASHHLLLTVFYFSCLLLRLCTIRKIIHGMKNILYKCSASNFSPYPRKQNLGFKFIQYSINLCPLYGHNSNINIYSLGGWLNELGSWI